MKIQKRNPIKWRKWSWIHLANANSAFLSCESYRWSWSAFILEIYCDQNYQNYCPQIFSWRIFCIISEMVYRFSLLMEKSSLLSIFFFISYHFKDTFWSKADVQYWKSSVFLAGEAFFKLLITLIFFRKRSTIFFVVKNIFQNYFFADALNNAPTFNKIFYHAKRKKCGPQKSTINCAKKNLNCCCNLFLFIKFE